MHNLHSKPGLPVRDQFFENVNIVFNMVFRNNSSKGIFGEIMSDPQKNEVVRRFSMVTESRSQISWLFGCGNQESSRKCFLPLKEVRYCVYTQLHVCTAQADHEHGYQTTVIVVHNGGLTVLLIMTT